MQKWRRGGPTKKAVKFTRGGDEEHGLMFKEGANC
jgi:hypothetical protein